jgi:hypothetical protein
MLTNSKYKTINVYRYSNITYYILYALSLLGISIVAPLYLSYFSSLVKIYISLFLIYKFNPFKKKTTCTDYDKSLIFNSAIFLLLTTTLGDMLRSINLKAIASTSELFNKYI